MIYCCFQVAFAGRSNVGKSSLIDALFYKSMTKKIPISKTPVSATHISPYRDVTVFPSLSDSRFVVFCWEIWRWITIPGSNQSTQVLWCWKQVFFGRYAWIWLQHAKLLCVFHGKVLTDQTNVSRHVEPDSGYQMAALEIWSINTVWQRQAICEWQ